MEALDFGYFATMPAPIIARELLGRVEYALKEIDALKRGSAQVSPAAFMKSILVLLASVVLVAERKVDDELTPTDGDSANCGDDDNKKVADSDVSSRYLEPTLDVDALKTAAVSLHNQGRTLLQASQQFEEIRAVLKSIAALMLFVSCKPSAQAARTTLKLLSRASDELATSEQHKDKAACVCSLACLALYRSCPALSAALKSTSTSSEFNEYAAMEADDLINCTYRAALFAAAASTTPLQQGDDSAATDSFLRRVNSSLLVGFEAMQDLPINTLKMRFVQCAFTAGEAIFTSAAGRPAHVEAALAALSLAAAASAELTDTAATLSTRSTRSGVRAALTDDERVLVSNLPALRINGCHVMTLRARAFLALGHVERSKQAAVLAEEALALASKDEGAGGVHLACLSLKLQLAIEENAPPAAEEAMRSLLAPSLACPFATARSCLLLLLGSACVASTEYLQSLSAELFGLLIGRFADTPFFVEACVCSMQHTLSIISPTPAVEPFDKFDSSTQQLMDRACATVALVIAQAKSTKEGVVDAVLATDEYAKLSALVMERANWLFSLRNAPKTVLQWCDLHEALQALAPGACDSLLEQTVAVLLLRAETYLQTHLYTDALEVAEKASHLLLCTQSLLILFRCLVHAGGAEKAVAAVVRLQGGPQGLAGDASLSARREGLRRLVLCIQITNNSPYVSMGERRLALRLLMREWLQSYTKHRLWHAEQAAESHMQIEADDATPPQLPDSCDLTYLDIVLQLHALYMQDMLQERPASQPLKKRQRGSSDQEEDGDEAECAPVPARDWEEIFNDIAMLRSEAIGGAREQQQQQQCKAEYSFHVSLASLRTELLHLFQTIAKTLQAVSDDGCNPQVLGADSFAPYLTFLADQCWNIPLLLGCGGLVQLPLIGVNGDNSDAHVSEPVEEELIRVRVDFLIVGESLYAQVPSEGRGCGVSRALCMLESASLQMELADTTERTINRRGAAAAAAATTAAISQAKTEGTGGDISLADFSPQLACGAAVRSVTTSDSSYKMSVDSVSLMRTLEASFDILQGVIESAATVDTSYAEEAASLQKLSLFRLLQAHCRYSSREEVMQFVSQREGSFMGLSEETLFECSHFCTGAFGPAAATRRLLQMSLQTCFRAKNHLLMGQIYSQLVSSSASRADALKYVEEFEQLILSQEPSGAPHALSSNITDDAAPNSTHAPFLVDDVDSIITTTFNYAVTLNEMGQAEIAERFMAKALNLIRFGSQTIKAKQRQIQSSYGIILNNKKARLALQREEVGEARQQLLRVQETPPLTDIIGNIENQPDAAAVAVAIKLPSSKEVALALKQLL